MGKNRKVHGKDSTRFKFVTWISGPIIMLAFALGAMAIWFLATETATVFWSVDFLMPTIMFLILPWFLFVWVTVICWPITTLDKNGIRSSFLGILRKRNISWDEVYEIRIFRLLTSGAYLFFSKLSLDGMSIYKARKQKGIVQVALSPKLLKAIRQFTDKEIINLPKELEEEHRGTNTGVTQGDGGVCNTTPPPAPNEQNPGSGDAE